MTVSSASFAGAASQESAWRVLVRAIGSGIAVFLVAQGVWLLLLRRMLSEPAGGTWELPAMAAFLVFGIVYLKRSPWPAKASAFLRRRVRFNAVPFTTILLALAAGWSTMLAGFLFYAAHRATSGMGGESPITLPNAHGALLIAGLAMAGIVAGTVEEIAFRGFMQGTLEKRFGVVPAIIVSGLVWALFHTNHSYFGEEALLWIGIFLGVAFLLGTIAHRTDSVVPGIIVHAGFDTAYFVAAGLLQPRIAPIAWIQSLASPETLGCIAVVFAVCATVAWVAFLRATGRAR
jgi:membrane protease YdiL (CAAX protease family)